MQRSVYEAVVRVLLAALIFGPAGCRSKSQPQKAPRVQQKAPVPPPPPEPPKRLFTKLFIVAVRQRPDNDSYRVGYLRAGSVLQAKTAQPIPSTGRVCRRGWYELETGGFVCNFRDVTPFEGKRLPESRALQPDINTPLPYPYGVNLYAGTPVYRRFPTPAEVLQFQGPDALCENEKAAHEAGKLVVPGQADAGVDSSSIPASVKAEFPGLFPQTVAAETASAVSAARVAIQALSAPSEADTEGADLPPPTLASLMGQKESVLERRMAKGFSVSLDREMRRGCRRYYRTQANGFIPFERLAIKKPPEFRGVTLGGTTWALPLAFVLSRDTPSYVLDQRGRLQFNDKPGYHFAFRVAAEEQIRGRRYFRTEDGRYFLANKSITRIDARPRPPEVSADEKWLDIDLGHQSLVAYEGDRPV
jgi:hypothetical protein